jgi:menaquinone-specific isochorismate synthase
MTNLSEINTVKSAVDLPKLKNSLKEKIRLELDREDSRSSDTIVRIEEPLFNIDPLKWLHSQKDDVQIYWSERDRDFEMAGIGFTDIVTGVTSEAYKDVFNRMRSNLKDREDSLRYYGGFRFDENRSSDPQWKTFGMCRFIIPQLEIIRQNGDTRLALNMRSDQRPGRFDEIIEAAVDKIKFQQAYGYENDARLQSRLDTPAKTEWSKNLEKTMAMFHKGELNKIVLARRSTLNFSRAINAIHVMNGIKLKSTDAFHFCFQLTKDVTFIGASPELLYRRTGNEIVSEAVAGTRPRGEDEAADEKLTNELLRSSKDIQEHAVVYQWIEQMLENLCESFESDEEIQVLKSTRVQHLSKQYRGILKERDDARVISMLHPTPAVAGAPKENSLKVIRELEGFDRGWYAGPVGWVGSNSAEFCVGIRSALVNQSKLHLYSGAGIVPDSDAELEWQELEHKISHYMSLFR